MEKRKEKIMLMLLQRRQQQEEIKKRKELEAAQKRDLERVKEEEKQKKKIEQNTRRALILEQHRQGKRGPTTARPNSMAKATSHISARSEEISSLRPKVLHMGSTIVNINEMSSLFSHGERSSSSYITANDQLVSTSIKRNFNKDSLVFKGPKLYKQPATKSNRSIILNAVAYFIFPGEVNSKAKQTVLEKIDSSESNNFLILFRDARCQFRALYSYTPENGQIIKVYGTGPNHVTAVMFDKFFKYNSGGKCFSQIHTKHLMITIDAFTIHDSWWQRKKFHVPI